MKIVPARYTENKKEKKYEQTLPTNMSSDKSYVLKYWEINPGKVCIEGHVTAMCVSFLEHKLQIYFNILKSFQHIMKFSHNKNSHVLFNKIKLFTSKLQKINMCNRVT